MSSITILGMVLGVILLILSLYGLLGNIHLCLLRPNLPLRDWLSERVVVREGWWLGEEAHIAKRRAKAEVRLRRQFEELGEEQMSP